MTDVGDAERGRMMILAGMNYDGGDIKAELGYSESTIYKHLNEIEAEAKAADDPYKVFAHYYLATIFDDEFRENVAGMLDSS